MTDASSAPPAAPPGHLVTTAALADDPYPLLHRLRREAPVAWAPALGMWLVTRRSDVLAVLRDAETFTVGSPDSPIADTFGAQMLSTDGDVHRRHKSHCAPPFNARAVREDSGPAVAAAVERLVARIEAAREGGEGRAELRGALAGPLATFGVAHALGLPGETHATVRAWYDDFAAALQSFDRDSPARAAGRRRAAEFRALVGEIVRGERRADARSLLAMLAVPGPDALDEREIGANALIVVFGGIETTEAAILNAAWALLSHPAPLDAVRGALARGDEAPLARAIEESLRWEPAVQTCHRWAARATTIAGVPIAEGDTVQCMIGAANRDPAHFDDPDRFDAARANAGDHLSFGVGRHFCLGAALARHEARLALAALLSRLPALRLDPERPSRPHGHEFRKPHALWVRWS